MIRVDEIYDEARKIIGTCDDLKLFRWLSDAVGMIANKEDLEGWKGYLDICTQGCGSCTAGTTCNNPAGCGRRCVALPREVDTVIGVNIGGQPVLGRSQLFSFHLNGPGDCRTICEWAWSDQGKMHCTYRELTEPAKLVAHLQTSADNGAQVLVYGYDDHGNVLRRQDTNGAWINGYQIPTIYGVAVPEVGAPVIARVTQLYKQPTVGSVRLSTIDDSGATGTLLTVMEPDETLPQYRRIQLNRSCNWVRIAYRKTNPIFTSKYDHIPLRSRLAILVALQARKHIADNQIAEAHSYEADAARMELEAQQMAEAPLFHPVQVVDMSNPRDKYDYDIR
jgi:YD repeat-containing protein